MAITLAVFVGDTQVGFAAPSPDPARSWLYGADSGANDLSSTLFRIDSVTGVVHTIGETGFVDVTDIAFVPDGRLFGITYTRFLEIQPQTGRAVPVGPGIGFRRVVALVSDANGVLYGGTQFGEFIRIDSRTGVGTLIGHYGGGLVASGDLAFAPDGTLFGTAKDARRSELLVRIDITTGKATIVGPIGFEDVFGIAFGPDDVLFGSAEGGPFRTPVLITIDQHTGEGTPVGSMSGPNGMFGLTANVKLAPVVGPLKVTGRENSACGGVTEVWHFCQHQTDNHNDGDDPDFPTIAGSQDLLAWDINLRATVNGQFDLDADNRRPVYAIAPGTVVRYAGVHDPQANNSGAVLVEHNPMGAPDCRLVGAGCWWSGYLHMAPIWVHEGEKVEPGTILGNISNVATDSIDPHLHFVVYQGENAPRGLQSVDVSFTHRASGPPNTRLRLNQSSFRAGDRITLTLTTIEGTETEEWNLYVGIFLPDRSLFFFQVDPSPRFSTLPVPARPLQVVSTEDRVIVDGIIPGGLPLGEWVWGAIFARPDLSEFSPVFFLPFVLTN